MTRVTIRNVLASLSEMRRFENVLGILRARKDMAILETADDRRWNKNAPHRKKR
jgi:hypothetical protein